MKIPIRILIGDMSFLGGGVTWGDIIDSWETYALKWNAADQLGVDPNEAPVLDMFGDEGITIKSVVKDLSDPKKLFTDFSRSFTVPASKKNNRIFKHYYNIDIRNGLDSRELINATIIMNNVTYKIGNLRVDSVSMKNGIAQNYKVTFIGKLSELSRRMGADRLSSLDLTIYDLPALDAKAEFSNTTKRPLMFPLATRKNRFLYDSSQAELNLEGVTNIAYAGATQFTDYGIRERDLVGALSVGALLDAMEVKYGFVFDGVFTQDYVRDLYLWLHQTDKTRQGENLTAIGDGFVWSPVPGASSAAHWVLNDSSLKYLGAGGVPETEGHIVYRIGIIGQWTDTGEVKLYRNGNLTATSNVSGELSYMPWVNNDNVGDVWTVEVESDVAQTFNNIRIVLDQYQYEREGNTGGSAGGDGYYSYYSFGVAVDGVTGDAGTFLINHNLPKMKVMDFLSSIFKMFNIVAEVTNDLQITTKHYDHFMSEGTLKDITPYVHVDNYSISRPNIFSSLQMEFADVKTALEQGYEAVNAKQYGEITYDLIGNNGVKLSGSEYKLKIENQRIPLEPLTNQANNTATGVVHAQFSDLKGAEQSIKPMFTYLARKAGGANLGFWVDTNVESVATYMMPCNTFSDDQAPANFYNTWLGLYFGAELNEYDTDKTLIGVGLWSSFYKGTTAMMFDEDKRRVKFVTELPQGVVRNLKLSDVLHISNKFYNINSTETNYLTGQTKLDLTLVGRSQLKEFKPQDIQVTNNHPTNGLYFTYIDNTTGYLKKGFIISGQSATLAMVGTVLGFSHDDYTLDDV